MIFHRSVETFDHCDEVDFALARQQASSPTSILAYCENAFSWRPHVGVFSVQHKRTFLPDVCLVLNIVPHECRREPHAVGGIFVGNPWSPTDSSCGGVPARQRYAVATATACRVYVYSMHHVSARIVFIFNLPANH